MVALRVGGLATVAGCADLDILPSWLPFQGPASDTIPGVVTPAERIAELRKLSAGVGLGHGRGETADLAAVGRLDPDGERPADPRGDHSCPGSISGPGRRCHPQGGAQRCRYPCSGGCLRGVGKARRRPGGETSLRCLAERRGRRRAVGCRQGAGRDQESAGGGRPGRGPERRATRPCSIAPCCRWSR